MSFRSPLPLLGLSSPAAQGGYRGLLAFWAGGACGVTPTDAGAGYRGLLAFWMGGAAAGPAAEPAEPTAGGAPAWRHTPTPRRRRWDELRPQEAPEAGEATEALARERSQPVRPPGAPQPSSVAARPAARGESEAAVMLRAELAQIETQAREREVRFAADMERMSAQQQAAVTASMLAARQRDNNRRAQILIALLMLD